MLKTLIKARLAAFWAGLGFDKKTGKKRSVGKIILFAFLYIYLIAFFLALFFGAFFLIGTLTLQTDMAWLYFATAALLAVLLAIVGTVFGTVTQLYEAKDNDLLLSMPISPKHILLSRILVLLLGNIAFEAVVLLPAFVMYLVLGIGAGVLTAWGLLSFLVGMLVLPVVSLTFSCLFGWLVALLLRRIRRKSLVQTVFSLALLGLYFYFYGKMMTASGDSLENIEALLLPLANGLKTYFYPFYLFGLGCAGHVGAGLLSLLFALVPACIVFWILAKSFIGIATAKTVLKKTEYREKTMKRASCRVALAKNNLSHLFHSTGYLMNSAMGLFMLAVAAVALIFGKNAFLASVLGATLEAEGGAATALPMDALAALLAGGCCFLLSMVMITAPSISVEAKTLWILRSSPLTGKDVLLSKVYASEVLSVPVVLLASLAIIFVTTPSWPVALGVLLLPQLFALFAALFDMVLGVAFPRLTWNNETEAVKQGMAVFLAMFGMMAIAMVTIFGGFALALLLSAGAALLLLTLLYAGLCALLLWIMLSVSARKFENMQV